MLHSDQNVAFCIFCNWGRLQSYMNPVCPVQGNHFFAEQILV
jgi:hypothetical protein